MTNPAESLTAAAHNTHTYPSRSSADIMPDLQFDPAHAPAYPEAMSAVPTTDVLYFGPYTRAGEPGHAVYGHNTEQDAVVKYPNSELVLGPKVSAALQCRDLQNGQRGYGSEMNVTDGEAYVYHGEGYSILSFAAGAFDNRTGASCTFLVPEENVSGPDILARASGAMPGLVRQVEEAGIEVAFSDDRQLPLKEAARPTQPTPDHALPTEPRREDEARMRVGMLVQELGISQQVTLAQGNIDPTDAQARKEVAQRVVAASEPVIKAFMHDEGIAASCEGDLAGRLTTYLAADTDERRQLQSEWGLDYDTRTEARNAAFDAVSSSQDVVPQETANAGSATRGGILGKLALLKGGRRKAPEEKPTPAESVASVEAEVVSTAGGVLAESWYGAGASFTTLESRFSYYRSKLGRKGAIGLVAGAIGLVGVAVLGYKFGWETRTEDVADAANKALDPSAAPTDMSSPEPSTMPSPEASQGSEPSSAPTTASGTESTPDTSTPPQSPTAEPPELSYGDFIEDTPRMSHQLALKRLNLARGMRKPVKVRLRTSPVSAWAWTT